MNSIRTLLAGIVDYAGLFPPAALPLEAAVRNYAVYRTDEDCDLLGRFVVPAARLAEFTNAACGLLDRGDGSDPWLVSALAGDDLEITGKAILDFNSGHSNASDLGHALCDSIEIQARKTDDIGAAVQAFPDSFRLFFEIAPDPDPVPLLREVARNRGFAKLRTGGVTETAFPTSTQIIRFIGACHQLGVPFKATAGLHHPLRSVYPLTYEEGSPRAMMFGYLNLFLAAAFVRMGMPETEAREILEERSLEAFSFENKRVSWRGHDLSEADLCATRLHLALSFGSCSFREPVDEARALNLL